MVLTRLQAMLSELYALDVTYDVDDFLVTDERLADALDVDGRRLDEKLLIVEEQGEASIALYVDAQVLERLGKNDPARQLRGDNIEDFWTALEGVSHFLYYVWNAAFEKSVTLMEMELQAEVDKFVSTALLLRRQGGHLPANLHRCLFDMPSFDARLDEEELVRYQSANRYAGKYCKKLAPQLAVAPGPDSLREELCYFYRLAQPGKIEHIESA
ncbi:MAG: hypothetical protein HKN84_05300 [Gammaproteobacteria bacterium]|nr:hypothetical protein [Gammaproteobacteria bacterium]